MAPPNKKQKTADDSVPVIFKSHDSKPDMRIKVFGKEFHVHSSVLKVHSQFFFKFLDSPEKIAPVIPTQFRYEYVSVVDEDGNSWGLEPVNMVALSPTTRSLENQQEEGEQTAFMNLLFAMYGMEYKITSACLDEIEDMIRLADFYRALPALSLSVSGLFLTDAELITAAMKSDPFKSLRVANKLRHRMLFRTALALAVAQVEKWYTDGNFDDWPKVSENGDQLSILLLTAHSRLRAIKDRADMEICTLCSEDSAFRRYTDQLSEAYVWGTKRGAMFYENVREYMESDCDHLDIYNALQAIHKLLQKDIVIRGFTDAESFYCAKITDEELPWDPAQTDW